MLRELKESLSGLKAMLERDRENVKDAINGVHTYAENQL